MKPIVDLSGHPEDLNAAIGVMYSLDLAARQLMETPNGLPGEETAGPSFEQVQIAALNSP